MKIIEIVPLENGAHQNQTGQFSAIPDGWAQIPDGMALPETFPFVNITVDGHTVTSITAGTVPEPAPVPVPDNPDADAMEAVLDLEVRMIQLEPGTNTAT